MEEFTIEDCTMFAMNFLAFVLIDKKGVVSKLNVNQRGTPEFNKTLKKVLKN